MNHSFNKVKTYLLDLNCTIVHESADDAVFVVSKKGQGIQNMVVGCADPILIMEQHILDLNEGSPEVFQQLLKKNRDIVHGAFVLDETGTKVIFRDTLQIENLDLNELEGSLNSLGLLLSEYSNELIAFSKS